jgi:hypothetical protein
MVTPCHTPMDEGKGFGGAVGCYGQPFDKILTLAAILVTFI